MKTQELYRLLERTAIQIAKREKKSTRDFTIQRNKFGTWIYTFSDRKRD